MRKILLYTFLNFLWILGISGKRGERLTEGRIVGGTKVNIEAIPYQVSVQNYATHICGGSILSAKFVITAAHCTVPFDKLGFSVRAGSSSSDQGGSIHKVGEVFEHPRFDSFLLDYDVSILKLEDLIKYDQFRKPIKLPYFGEITLLGSLVSTSGFGLTMNKTDNPTDLRIVELKISSRIQCHNAYIMDGGITSRMICAYSQGKDSCSGGEKESLGKFKIIFNLIHR